MDPAPSLSHAANAAAPPTVDKRSALYDLIAFFLEGGIQIWVRITGKRMREADAPWLRCPLGERGRIGTGIYERIARDENLQIRVPPGAGLIPDFNALRGPNFNPDAIHPAIRDFYEHAAAYHLEVWTEVSLLGRFFLWLLVEFISRRMEQLNFPISSLEVAKGMSSEVVQLLEPASGRIVYTGWLRRLKSSGHVIYAGLYSTTARLVWTLPAPLGAAPASIALFAPAQSTGAFGTSRRSTSFSTSTWTTKASCAPNISFPSSASPSSASTTKCPRHHKKRAKSKTPHAKPKEKQGSDSDRFE